MRYLSSFFLALALPLLLLAAVNVAIDPYGVFGMPVRAHVNDAKFLANDRFVKPLQVLRRTPDVVYFGSSRVLDGLNPEDLPGRDIYNFGVPAATLAEMDVFARHVMAVTPATLLVFGLDYVSFDDTAPPRAGFDPGLSGPLALWKSLPRLLISAQTTRNSRSVVRNSRNGASGGYHANGFFELTGRGVDAGSAWYYAQVVAQMGPATRSLAVFDALLEEAERRGVKAMVFLPPLHAELPEALFLRGQNRAYEAWLRSLVAICEAHHAPLWDFSGYNRETTIPLDGPIDSFIDGGHMAPRLGKVVQETLLQGKAEEGFGERLFSSGLQAYLDRQHIARAAWQTARPQDLRAIRHAVLRDGDGS